jgi:di/tricarboxylate transporter
MSLEAWFTLIVVGLCLAALISNRVGADTAMMGGLSLLLVTGIVTPAQGLAGFANEGMITVGVLFVVVAGLRDTGAVSWIVKHLLGRPRGLADAQMRIMAPVSAMSAFLNNTPVVAMMIPAIQDWGRRFQISPSRLLIPLSYAAIAGGTCTLIGTSTNLVIHGLLIDRTGQGFSMFELAWIGIPVVVLVMVSVMIFGRRLLPERIPAKIQFADARRYTVEMLVAADGPLAGRTVEQAGLRQLPGLYLIEIYRGETLIPAPAPTDVLLADDRLVFAGAVESVVDLQKINGLIPATDQIFKLDAPRPERCLIEAVISRMHPMVGKSIRAGRFRSVYNAAVIAVSRSGEQVKGKIGDIVLRPGDTLLLEAHPSFVVQHRNSRDFYLVSELEGTTPLRHERAPLAVGILAIMVLLAAFDVMSMLNASLLAAGAMLITRCTTGRVARRSVDWQILIVIAASIGIGNALYLTGAAQAIAESMLAFVGMNPWSVLLMVYALTALFTAVVTNNTAAVLMFPIVFALAEQMGVSHMPYMITVTVAASMSFATPIGYQTNLMVMGPGGYRFSDYLYLGIPITILVGVLVMAIVPLVWPF